MDFETPSYSTQEATQNVTPDAIESIRLKVLRGIFGKTKKRVMLDLPENLNARADKAAEALGLETPVFIQALLDEVLPL